MKVDVVYEWIKNLAFYLVIVTAVLEILPGDSYKKYIRFFAGLVLILLTVTPFLRMTGTFKIFQENYREHESELLRQEIMESREYFEQADVFDFLQKEADTELKTEIRVEEIEIGENQKSDFNVDTHGRKTSSETTTFDPSADRIVVSGDHDSGTGE